MTRKAGRLAFWFTVGTLAWGVGAFGAVYPWGYRALQVGCLMGGLLGFAAAGATSLYARPLLPLGIAAVVLATFMQLVPLPLSALQTLSPAAIPLLQKYDLGFGHATLAQNSALPAEVARARHSLSISPVATWRGMAFLVTLAVFLFGLAALFSVTESATLAALIEALLFLGVLLALTGIAQRAMFNGHIYGFWKPRFSGQPFGPFMNRNHFAGWMLMMIPLGVAYFVALLDRAMRGVRPAWRQRLLWFASDEANRAVLIGIGLFVMTVSLFMTFSRSGISCFVASQLVVAGIVIRRHTRGSRRRLGVGYVLLVVLAGTLWAGVDAVAERFELLPGSELGGRVGPWSDTVGIIKDFPLTGTGLNTFGVATLFYQRHDLHTHYQESHNDYLQLAAEGGVLLGVPIVVAALLFARETRSRLRAGGDDQLRRWLRLGAIVGILAVCLQDMSEFSLQMPADAALFATLCALAIHAPASEAGREILRSGRPDRDIRASR